MRKLAGSFASPPRSFLPLSSLVIMSMNARRVPSGSIMSNKKLFALSTALTTCATLVVLYIQRPGSRPVPLLVSESGSVYVSPQISLRDVGYIARYGIHTIVDMRPDGEASDEPSHLQIEQIAKAQGLDFSYIPVPHESIPPTTVNALGELLLSSQKPVVLYCRTGRRAVRTFALFEASRHGGPSADTILAMVKDAGFSAEDLRPEIVSRIAARTAPSEAKQ
jgi:uncharacterized protein (TIGR01244 family)